MLTPSSQLLPLGIGGGLDEIATNLRIVDGNERPCGRNSDTLPDGIAPLTTGAPPHSNNRKLLLIAFAIDGASTLIQAGDAVSALVMTTDRIERDIAFE